MTKIMRFAFAAVVAAALAVPAAASPKPVSVTAALAMAGRSPDNVKLDDSRKPAAVLAFLGLRPGMTALDCSAAINIGRRSWLQPSDPKGKVIVWETQAIL